MRRVSKFLARQMPAGLVGSFFLLTFAASEAFEVRVPRLVVGGAFVAVAGWLLGVVVVAIIRRFRVAPWAYPIAGLFSGPIPFVLLFARSTTKEEWGGVWLVSALLGAMIGFVEWARVQRVERERSSDREFSDAA